MVVTLETSDSTAYLRLSHYTQHRLLFARKIYSNYPKLFNYLIVAVYCPFPGVLANGLILLVGHMGMYEYRDYVKKVSHKKQIVYQCNKGFHVSGASGATCVDGQWSPAELPQCVLGVYPTLDWLQRRRRRSFHSRDHAKHIKSSPPPPSEGKNQKSVSQGHSNTHDSEDQFLLTMAKDDSLLLSWLHSLDDRLMKLTNSE